MAHQQSREGKEKRPETGRDLNNLLEKVMESSDRIVVTPEGRKKGEGTLEKREVLSAQGFGGLPEGKKVCPMWCRVMARDTETEAEDQDYRMMEKMGRQTLRPTKKTVRINKKEHLQSPFVISLRECALETEPEERHSTVPDQLAFSRETLAERTPVSYETLRNAWLASGASPQKMNKKPKRKGWLQGLGDHARRKIRYTTSTKEKLKPSKKQHVQEDPKPRESVKGGGYSYRKLFPARAMFCVAGGALVMMLPVKALLVIRDTGVQKSAVQEKGIEAAAALSGLQGGGDLVTAADRLQEASGKFRQAGQLLDRSHGMAVGAAAVMPATYRSARALLEVGDKLALSGNLLTQGLNKIFSGKDGMIERVEMLGAYTKSALPLLTDAEQAAAQVDAGSVPEAYREQIAELPEQIREAKTAVREAASLSDFLTVLLGKDHLRNYLLVFQNNSELRPSGGFMGSVAEVRMDRGKIQSIYVPPGGTYDLKGQLTERVQAPLPMHLINPLWQFQDANWFADFPETAEKIRWFWSRSGQPTLDGVIAVNASFMEEVLTVLGPVEMPEYGKTITASNFLLETQKAVELEYDQEKNTPKKFIGDLFDRMLERSKTLSEDEWIRLATAAAGGLRTKEIQIAMYNPEEEEQVERFEWNGRFKETDGDFLAIVGTNIAGQKTDGVIREAVEHQTEIQEDGSIVDRVRIHRVHEGQKGELFRGVRNVQYLRVYVPKGAELKLAKGFEAPSEKLFKKPLDTDEKDPALLKIEETAKEEAGGIWSVIEKDWTVFGGWLQLDPGQTQEIELVYRLPMTVQDVLQDVDAQPEATEQEMMRGAYTMLFTSQSGTRRQLTHRVQIAEPWKSIWSRGTQKEEETEDSAMVWSGEWREDRAMAILLTTQTENYGR